MMLHKKLKTELRFGYSEEDMANGFQKLISASNGLPKLGSFDGIYREVSCRQGKPDFIGIKNISPKESMIISNRIGLVDSTILSILKPNSPRRIEYIMNNTEFTDISIRKSLKILESNKYIRRTSSGSYCLDGELLKERPEIWTFELKLQNHKKALFQAQQARIYANRVFIVVPPGQDRNYVKYLDIMRRWDIGLATFDLHSMNFNLIIKNRKVKAFSNSHQLHTLSQICPC